MGVVINITSSIPIGIYLKTNSQIENQKFVLICPPNDNEIIKLGKERGYIEAGKCPGKYGHIMKEIVGVPGDHVIINKKGVFLNGQFIKDSKPLKIDSHNRLMPLLISNKILRENEYLVMGLDNPLSFDSRYFGFIEKRNIVSTIKPLIIYK